MSLKLWFRINYDAQVSGLLGSFCGQFVKLLKFVADTTFFGPEMVQVVWCNAKSFDRNQLTSAIDCHTQTREACAYNGLEKWQWFIVWCGKNSTYTFLFQ